MCIVDDAGIPVVEALKGIQLQTLQRGLVNQYAALVLAGMAGMVMNG